MKRTIIFIIPNLIKSLPAGWQKSIETFKTEPTFERIFKGASQRREEQVSFMDTIRYYFQLTPEDQLPPWSLLSLKGEKIHTHEKNWFRIGFITDQGFPMHSIRNIQALAEDFARDFAFGEDAIVTDNGNWYISLQTKNQVASTPIWLARKDEPTLGLSGPDAAAWQLRFRAANEWLRKHSINRSRARRRHVLLHGFWPWGNNGVEMLKGAPEFTAVFSDNPMFLGLGEQLGLSFFPLRLSTGDLDQMVLNHPRICVIDDSLIKTVSENSFSSWARARGRICSQFLEPAILAVERGIVDELIVDDAQGEQLVYSKRIKFVMTKPKFTYSFI